jgi:hypothetical protein
MIRKIADIFKEYVLQVVGVFLTAAMIYTIIFSHEKLIHISIFAIIAGVIFENRRLGEKWNDILRWIITAFPLSLLILLPGKHEKDYSFTEHVTWWPYFFLGALLVLSISMKKEKITPRLTEGKTLVQSLAIIYWIVDLIHADYSGMKAVGITLLTILGIPFVVHTFYNAFSKIPHSRTSKFFLSIWSSLIMFIFAIENIYRIYSNGDIENAIAINVHHGLYVALQYFLLGVSSMYIANNICVLFILTMNRWIDPKHMEKSIESHIKQYSDEQISIGQSIATILIAGGIFAINYHYEIVPRHIAIWTVFVILPIIMYIQKYFTEEQTSP